MSDDAVNESRADWRGSDDKKPPIMGKQQPIRSYMEDVAKWASRKEVSDEKCGALMLTRGLSKCPRLMDLGKKLPRNKLRHSDGLRFLFDFLQKETGAADMSMKVRRFAELVRDRRKVGMPVGTYMEAFEAKLREIRKDGFVEVDEKLAGTLLIIGLELTNQELSELMTAIDAQKGYEAFCIHKVMDAAKRVVFPPLGRGGGKPGPPQWVYYGADWGSQDWNWEGARANWTDDCGGAHGEGGDSWDDSYGAYLGYTQCKECPKYPFTDGKGKGKERGKEGHKKEGEISGKSKGKGIGEGKKTRNPQTTHFAKEKVEEAAFTAFTAQDIHLGGAGSPLSLQDIGSHEGNKWRNGCGNGRPSPVVSEESGREHGGTFGVGGADVENEVREHTCGKGCPSPA